MADLKKEDMEMDDLLLEEDTDMQDSPDILDDMDDIVDSDNSEEDELDGDELMLEDDTEEEVKPKKAEVKKTVEKPKAEKKSQDASKPQGVSGELGKSDVSRLMYDSVESSSSVIDRYRGNSEYAEEDTDGFELRYVDIQKVGVMRRFRMDDNVHALIKSIKSTGLLCPIVVANTTTEGVYVLLDGYRRLIACARSGRRYIPCVVNKRVKATEIPVLEAMYNQHKDYKNTEIIEYIKYLEKEKGIQSATMIEYLLQLNTGDHAKLKDILEDNDEDIVSKLKQDLYTIGEAYKKLEARRKKENQDEKEMQKTARVYNDEDASGISEVSGTGDEVNDDFALSEEEINSIKMSAGDIDAGDETIEELIEEGKHIEGFQPHKQDPKYRERLDPALRKSVLAKYNNECQICHEISGQEYVEVLDIHHIQEVYLGGSDDIDNLIPACTCCHKLIHLYGRGDLYIRPLEEMTDKEREKFKRVIKLGNIIRKGMAARGMKRDELKKMDNCETIGRTKPGTGQVAG